MQYCKAEIALVSVVVGAKLTESNPVTSEKSTGAGQRTTQDGLVPLILIPHPFTSQATHKSNHSFSQVNSSGANTNNSKSFLVSGH